MFSTKSSSMPSPPKYPYFEYIGSTNTSNVSHSLSKPGTVSFSGYVSEK